MGRRDAEVDLIDVPVAIWIAAERRALSPCRVGASAAGEQITRLNVIGRTGGPTCLG